ncbi:MAG: hypothetical protein NPIRA02_24460 [Nitrospirales bacterium]|nr:MAG: hypothetical protein NPIRA02_24460 [Nitrospirales bacterium]
MNLRPYHLHFPILLLLITLFCKKNLTEVWLDAVDTVHALSIVLCLAMGEAMLGIGTDTV